jgi:hypothetical protein
MNVVILREGTIAGVTDTATARTLHAESETLPPDMGKRAEDIGRGATTDVEAVADRSDTGAKRTAIAHDETRDGVIDTAVDRVTQPGKRILPADVADQNDDIAGRAVTRIEDEASHDVVTIMAIARGERRNEAIGTAHNRVAERQIDKRGRNADIAARAVRRIEDEASRDATMTRMTVPCIKTRRTAALDAGRTKTRRSGRGLRSAAATMDIVPSRDETGGEASTTARSHAVKKRAEINLAVMRSIDTLPSPDSLRVRDMRPAVGRRIMTANGAGRRIVVVVIRAMVRSERRNHAISLVAGAMIGTEEETNRRAVARRRSDLVTDVWIPSPDTAQQEIGSRGSWPV